MSEWITFVKQYAEKNNITYREALKTAGDAYKNRNNVIVEPVKPIEKPKRTYNKKVKENIPTLSEPIGEVKPRKPHGNKK